MKRFMRLAVLHLFVWVCALAGGALAQSYPVKPVHLVVPFVAGGPTDIIAREVGQKLAESWKQPVIVDNRPGAGSNLAADAVAKAPPDGYAILITNPSLAVSPSLYRRLPFDALKDFTEISQIASTFLVLVSTPQFNSVHDLVGKAKAQPGRLNYASPGIGSINHLMSELFKMGAGVSLVHVPYKGDAESIRGMLAGEVDIALIPPLVVLPQTKTGKLKALAVTSPKRANTFPDVPTALEAGIPDIQYIGWLGFFAPAGTPATVVNQISADASRAVRLPDLAERLRGFGFEPLGTTPGEFAAKFHADAATFERAIKQAHVPLAD